MRTILSLCGALIILSGCNTYQKQLKRSTGFFQANKVELAKLCESEFKPETLRVSKTDTLITLDTVYAKQDSVPCPPVKGKEVVFVKCPPAQTVYKTLRLRDTVTVTDPKRETILTAELRLKTDTLYKTREDKAKVTQQRDTNRKLNWILGGIILLSIAWRFGKNILITWFKSATGRI